MSKRASRIYCGDGSSLPTDYNRFGSRYECMQCGFGAAMMKYKWEEKSTDIKLPPRDKKGCLRPKQHKKGVINGNQFVLVSEDSDMDSFAIFASPEEGEGNKFRIKKKTIIICLVWFVLSAALFLAFFFGKPNIIMEQTVSTEQKRIDWRRFIIIYCILVLICPCAMYFILHL